MWTTPITWVAGQVVTAATMNAQVSGNLNWLAGADHCQVTNTGNQSLTVGSLGVLTWNQNTVISNAGMHSTSVNPTRLIAATAGTYRIGLSLVGSSATNIVDVDVRKNAAGSNSGGTDIVKWALTGVNLFAVSLDNIALAANDYLEVFAQGSGGTMLANTSGTYVDFRWVNF